MMGRRSQKPARFQYWDTFDSQNAVEISKTAQRTPRRQPSAPARRQAALGWHGFCTNIFRVAIFDDERTYEDHFRDSAPALRNRRFGRVRRLCKQSRHGSSCRQRPRLTQSGCFVPRRLRKDADPYRNGRATRRIRIWKRCAEQRARKAVRGDRGLRRRRGCRGSEASQRSGSRRRACACDRAKSANTVRSQGAASHHSDTGQ